jgi:anti-sigma-K factor RskA
MARRNIEDLELLERLLVEAHRARPTPVLGEEWARNVMRDIRREAAASAGKRNAWVQLHVWRTAALAAAFALVFAGSLFLYSGAERGELTASLSEELESAPGLLE